MTGPREGRPSDLPLIVEAEHPTTAAPRPASIPADVDTEAALIGAALIDTNAARIVAGIPDAAWYHPQHRTIAAAIRDVLAAHDRADVLLVTHQLRAAGIGYPTLRAMFADTPAVSAASAYAAIVERHHRHRDIVHAAADLSAAAMHGDEDGITDAADRIRRLT